VNYAERLLKKLRHYRGSHSGKEEGELEIGRFSTEPEARLREKKYSIWEGFWEALHSKAKLRVKGKRKKALLDALRICWKVCFLQNFVKNLGSSEPHLRERGVASSWKESHIDGGGRKINQRPFYMLRRGGVAKWRPHETEGIVLRRKTFHPSEKEGGL